MSGGSSSLWGNAEMTCGPWKVSASLHYCFYCTKKKKKKKWSLNRSQGLLCLGGRIKGNDDGIGQGQKRKILRIGSRRCVE